MPPLRLVSPFLLASALAAQTTADPAVAPNRFVPADSCLVVRMAAPTKWQQRFQKTQVMKLLQAQTLEPLLGQLRKVNEEMLEQLRSSGKFDADLVQQLLEAYTGDLTFSVQVDWEDVAAAIQDGRTPAISLVFALSPGEGIDLAKLAAEIGQAIERESEGRRPLRDATIGDLRLRVSADSHEMQANVPALIDDHLVMVMVFGGEFEPTATRLLATADRYQGSIGSDPLSVHAKLGPMVATMLPALGDAADMSGAPFDAVGLLRDMGFGALDSFSLSVGADDRNAIAEFEVALGDGDPGFFGAFLGDDSPKLLHLVPAGSDYFGVGNTDWNGLYGTFAKLWDGLGDVLPLSREDAEDAFAEATKVRLHEDLIAHLGTAILSVQSYDPDAAAEVDMDDPMSALGNMCMCISLRDGTAFGDSLEKALRSRGMHAGRKTEEYAGTKVHLLRIGGVFEVEYAVAEDLLLIAPGEGEAGRRNLRAVLDARKQADTAAVPAALEAHLKEMPSGWTGVSVAPVAAVLAAFQGALNAAAATDGVPFDVDTVRAGIEGLAGDVQRLGIEHLVSATYTTKRSMRTHMRW